MQHSISFLDFIYSVLIWSWYKSKNYISCKDFCNGIKCRSFKNTCVDQMNDTERDKKSLPSSTHWLEGQIFITAETYIWCFFWFGYLPQLSAFTIGLKNQCFSVFPSALVSIFTKREGDWFQSYWSMTQYVQSQSGSEFKSLRLKPRSPTLQVTHNGAGLFERVGVFLFRFNYEFHVRALNAIARNFLFWSITLERQSFHQRNPHQIH